MGGAKSRKPGKHAYTAYTKAEIDAALTELVEIVLASYLHENPTSAGTKSQRPIELPTPEIVPGTKTESGLDASAYAMIHSECMSEEALSPKARIALRHIRNALVHSGRVPSVRQLMTSMDYKSPRSAALLIEELAKKGFLRRKTDGNLRLLKDLEAGQTARTVQVPLVGSVACGLPLLAEESIEAMIPVSTNLARAGSKYFLLRAKGDSMNKAGINDGDLVLIRQQATASEGDKVVALIDDEATIKEFHREKEVVVLKPQSRNPEHRPIILSKDFHIQGVAVATIPNLEV